MGYSNLRQCLADLERAGQLVRIAQEIDPDLEAAAIQRRVYQAQGPAIYFARVKGCSFPMVSNLFGTLERTRFLFRDTLAAVRHLVELKVDPAAFWKRPFRYRDVPGTLWHLRPKKVSGGPVLEHQTTVERLPQLRCWPRDGGAFITLPQVYTEDADRPGWAHSNLGMYRMQLSGNEYQPGRQVGLHYQIHRGIGVHHAAALRRGVPFRVNVFVGGPPALTLAAVMPLPEGLPELAFAGALGGRRVRLATLPGGLPIAADADFCITGTVDRDKQLPEGPFGDHLGYYSLAHPFPVLNVERVYHRSGAIWPFTVVGRPPQEDTCFGQIIHELTGPIIPTVIPGVHAVHAVDAAGVHPLLLAVGSERYVPYAARRKPQELLTCASAILGQGQLALAKYLMIVAREDDPNLDIHDIPAFFRHLLERADWRTDLHFQTSTTMDTLDYSGTGLNEGSKVVIAAAGPPRRRLPGTVPDGLALPHGFSEPRMCLPGILAIKAPPYPRPGAGEERQDVPAEVVQFCAAFRPVDPINEFPLILLVDDSDFTSRTLNNFLWVTFTRSNPAADVHGMASFSRQKHWGCERALVIDARIKPHHAPPLEEDPSVSRRVDALGAGGAAARHHLMSIIVFGYNRFIQRPERQLAAEMPVENSPVGRVTVHVKVENVVDLYNAETGIIGPEQVHRLEIPDALVDTGATYLAMPRRLIEQLGFQKPFTTHQARTTRGLVSAGVFGPVRLTVQGRFCNVDIAEVEDDCPVLIGQVPLELLDLVVDSRGQQLIGNPRHGGQHMFELY